MTPKENAQAHWEYVKGVLAVHGVQEDELTIIGHHYVTAFCHGFKHGEEGRMPAWDNFIATPRPVTGKDAE